jgi:hypothetical protein
MNNPLWEIIGWKTRLLLNDHVYELTEWFLSAEGGGS